MAPIPGSVRVTGFIAPTDSTDTYATQDDTYNRGGYRAVANAAARLAITMDRRKEGMLVKQLDTGAFWTLSGGIADINWVLQTLGGPATIRFVGNGVFPIDTRVDGAWIAPANCTISSVVADVGERGTNDGGVTSTIWDVNLNGVSIFAVTPANRPTIAATPGGGEASAASGAPDTVAVNAGDRITVDTDQVSNGTTPPADFSIIIRVV